MKKHKKIEKKFNEQLEKAIDTYTKSMYTRNEVLAIFKEILDPTTSNNETYLAKNTASFKEQSGHLVKNSVGSLKLIGESWNDETVRSWYTSVAEYVLANEHTLQENISQYGQAYASAIFSNTEPVSPEQLLTVRSGGRLFTLDRLLQPATLYRPKNPKAIVIKEPAAFETEDLIRLFAYNKDYNDDEQDTIEIPAHQQLQIGELAYADLIFLNHDLSEMLTDTKVRKIVQTLLEHGKIDMMVENVRVTLPTECNIIANDNPDDHEESFDPIMYENFSIVKWPEIVAHNKKTVRSFPRIIKNATQEHYADMNFTPEAMNLLYHQLLCMTEPADILPARVGEMKSMLLEPLLVYVKKQKRTAVTADDVIDYLWSRRDTLSETMLIQKMIEYLPTSIPDMTVGQVNILLVNQHGFGGSRKAHALITKNSGAISSIEEPSKLADPTYNKGVRSMNAWLHKRYGPFNLEASISVSAHGFTAGPSASAAITYAGMSALGEIPIDQRKYITGTIVDGEGNVGVIGGVYGKARGAYLTAKRYAEREGVAMKPIGLMIPEGNVCELLRNMMFDRELCRAMDDGLFSVTTHKTIDDGFEQMSGLTTTQYDAKIRENIAREEQTIADHKKKFTKKE